VSTGGGDKTVMVWDTNLNSESVFDKQGQGIAGGQFEEDPEQEMDEDLLEDIYDRSKE